MATINGSSRGDVLRGTGVNDTVRGLGGNDTLLGNGGDDRLLGGEGDDLLRGGTGDNLYVGDRGDDTFDGRASDFGNTVDYGAEEGRSGVVVNLGSGRAIDSYGDTDRLLYIDGVYGTRSDDRFTVTTFPAADSDPFASFAPGAGDDTITGTLQTSPVFFYVQVDYSEEFARGGRGAIVANWATGTVLDPYGDTDSFSGVTRIGGTRNADTFLGDANGNRVRSYAGDDTVNGRDGADMIEYNRDARVGGTAGVTVHLGKGVATDGFGDHDRLISVERVRATENRDVVTGSDADNTIETFGSNDVLSGGRGNDRLTGGDGFDTLTGGMGADAFNFDAPGPRDTITDFTRSDQLDFAAAAFGLDPGDHLEAGVNFLVSNSPGAAVTGGATFLYERDTGILRFDADGTGAGGAVGVAVFTSTPGLIAEDFTFL